MANKELHNESMAKTIWHDALQCSMKPFSWGLNFNDIKVIDGGTAFHVLGKVAGWIKIQYQRSMNHFRITITPDNSEESEITYESVFLNQIVPVIDATIKNGTSCHNLICSQYGLLPKIAGSPVKPCV